MSDLLNKLSELSPWLIPAVFFAFGLTSSLHCVGMCGPLSFLASQGGKGNWLYQLGRLCGYMSLGLVLSFLGRETLNLMLAKIGVFSWYLLLTVILLTAAFAFSTKAKLYFSKLLESFSSRLMSGAIRQQNKKLKSLMIGLSSVFLPCGVLYLAIISVVALSSPLLTVFGILFFWMGTLPLMQFGLPQMKTFLARFSFAKSRLNAAIVLVLCGLVLASRFPQMIEAAAAPHCH